ncbi:fumarylacetoacetate hydrolase family protein [Alteraurantiacibacter aestuarii]|uniref:Fumarylacetoacetate hydrolase n=1 Tax=Alteraurantiacibacter aestuarii TaxID=650004 RepID=A0A844ZM34_9SPHN|nr:fumarylacetoacetate hydrolase family protein [Alteraurantiacibacter aestuarii]MXO88166.1 fumarylacetoacetate hydrolase [Alteraurantiacibacter aestuarii]
MILATLHDGTRDGRLVLVSPAYDRFAAAPLPTLQQAIEDWPAFVEAAAGVSDFPQLLDPASLTAPLPRAWQWLDGSVFPTHADLMQIALGHDPIESDRPLMYQGMSDRFYGPTDDVPLPSEDDGIDFEGEFGVIVDHVPMGTSADDALKHIKLIVQINDWSLRAIAPVEMKTGFGWVQAKPACSMAPFAVTPEVLGSAWQDGRVGLDLHIEWNGKAFGHANGRAMQFGFHELVAHAALTRDLVAGTIIGSGTVSNVNYAEVGSSCISEVRAIEMIADGKAKTGFMRFGDKVRMEARATSGAAPFGAIDQQVVAISSKKS